MSLNHRYGPFNPQELDPVLKWLERESIVFDLIKDENSENKFKDNGPENILALSKLRTDVYLAQIFYLEIEFTSQIQQTEFEKKFISKTEVIPIWLGKLTEPIETKKVQKGSFSRKNIWALVLLIVWVIMMIFGYVWEMLRSA